jgi:hypothetical protein
VIDVRKLAAVDLVPRTAGHPAGIRAGGDWPRGARRPDPLAKFVHRVDGVRDLSRELGINYAPLFLYAVRLQSHGSAHAEIADEADDKKKLFRKYRRQSLWVLVPFLVPVVALAQERRRAAVLLRDR